jgi:hypothetical protein
MNPKKVDFEYERLLPPTFSFRPFGVCGLTTHQESGDDGPTAIDKEEGKMRAIVLRIYASI